MGIWDERFSRCYSIAWLRELVLSLLEARVASIETVTERAFNKAADTTIDANIITA